MNFDALETFYWVARLSSFRKAADRLHLTQPAVSQRIRHLEEDLGATLLERSRPSVRLTPKGQQCLQYVERMLSARSDLAHAVGSGDNLTGMISMGVGETVAMTWLGDLLLDLELAYPGLDVDISIDTTDRLWDGLRNNLLDVVLVGGLTLPAHYRWDSLGTTELVWVARADYEGGREATPALLAGERVLSLHRGTFLHGVVKHWFADGGVVPSRWVLSSNLSSLLALAMEGVGLGLVPRPVALEPLRTGSLVEITPRPAIPPIEFLVACAPSSFSALGAAVAKLAIKRSTFRLPSALDSAKPRAHKRRLSTRVRNGNFR